MKKLLLLLAVLAFTGSNAFALELKIVNKTGKELHELYFAPAGETDWGPDQLSDEVVENGGSFTLHSIPKGNYDVLFVDENQMKCDLRDVDFTSSEVFVMTKALVKGCQAESDQGDDEEEDEE